MSVQTCIARRASEILSLLPRNMLPRLWISKALREPEVNQVDAAGLLAADQKVVWLDVAVKKVIRLYMLYSFQHLNDAHQNSFEAELPLTIVKQLLQARS